MTEEMRKRLEEAAKKYIKETIPGDIPCYDSVVETTKQDFLAGAELGYKEAIAQCNDAIVDIANEYFGDFEQSIKLAEKVTDRLNKLWEGEK